MDSMAISPTGLRLATGYYSQIIKVWELTTGRCELTTGRCEYTLQGHSKKVGSLVFSPSGSLLASGSEDGTLKI
jgi:WD40 repeat protein